jgi:hypothetical protein
MVIVSEFGEKLSRILSWCDVFLYLIARRRISGYKNRHKAEEEKVVEVVEEIRRLAYLYIPHFVPLFFVDPNLFYIKMADGINYAPIRPSAMHTPAP